MKTLMVLCAILTLSFAGQRVCPHGWTLYGSRCLRYVSDAMTWAQAKDHCEALKGKLASVYMAEMAHDNENVMQDSGRRNGKVWISGNRSPKIECETWFDLPPYIEYRRFCNGLNGKRKDHCPLMIYEARYRGCLNYTACDNQLPSVCSNTI